MSDRENEPNWDAITPRVLHEAQLLIIETLRWMDQPLSAANLTKVFDDDELGLSTVSYHVRRLVDLGVLKLVKKRPVRGAVEKFYRLRVWE